jgi:predicted phage terminase large subunit-like protein
MIKVPFPNLVAKNLYLFVQFAFRQLVGKRLDTEQRYIEYICHVLQQFLAGDVTQLLINLPGRHLKTFICSVCLPAFLLGRHPTLRFLVVAYDEDIAEDIVRQIRELMSSHFYQTVFKTRISPDHSRKNDFKVVGGGRVRAAPVRSVTGKGGDIIIFDDPHNVHDWNNEFKKQKVIEAFGTLMTRRDGGGDSQVLVVAHRIAEDDLSAHILERGDFELIRLPLFAAKAMDFEIGDDVWHLSKGEALRQDAFPPKEIEKLRTEHLGSPFWLHFQQGLGPKEDQLDIDVRHFPFFRGEHRGIPVVLSVDPTSKTASSSRNVIHVYAVDGHSYILLQAFAEACKSKRLFLKVKHLAERYNASLILIEETGRGGDLIEQLEAEVNAKVEGIIPRGSKFARLRKFIPLIRAQRIRIKQGRDAVEEAIDEIVSFPNAEYTDHVDALTNFLERASRFPKEPLPVFRKRSTAVVGSSLGRAWRQAKPEARGTSAAFGSVPGYVESRGFAGESSPGSPSPYQAPAEPQFIISGFPSGPIVKRTQ